MYIVFFIFKLSIEEIFIVYSLWIIFMFLFCGFVILVILYSIFNFYE